MSGLVDLSPPHLAIVEQILSEHVPDCEVRAFGSRATWTAKDYSDLDLAIVGDGPLDRRTLGRLQEAFEESTLPMRVDVVDLRSITDSFRESIELEAVLLKGKEVKRVSDRDWRTARWGELATLEYGKSLRDYDNHGDRYKVYGTNGPIGWHSEPLCPYASVIIGRKGAYRGIHYSAEPFFVIDTAFYLKPLVEFDTKWAYYQLLTQDINRLDSGSAIPSTSREDFYSLSVKVPSLEEQRAIARVLGTLDDKIELNRRMSETLDEMARALFRSWFVDFDPVHAKAEGRPSGLPSDLDVLFPDSLEPSQLGDIPSSWRVAEFGEIVEQHRDNENPLDSPDMPFDHYSIPAYDVARTPTKDLGVNIRSIKTRVAPDTVLLSRLNPDIERVWLSDVAPGDRAVCSTEFMVLKPRRPIDRNYIYCLTRSPSFRRQIESLVTGTSKSHQRARPDAVLSLPVLVPPAPIIHGFGEQVSPALIRTLHFRRAMNTLAALRDTLLPKLLSGEVRLTDSRKRATIGR